MHTAVKKSRLTIFRRHRRKALTLPEVVVAAALLLAALVPILKGLTQANMNSAIIERRTQSLCLAQAKLNNIQARSIYDFNSISSSGSDESLNDSYLCRTIVSSVNINLKSITVSVGQDRNPLGSLGNDEIEITLRTQIARRW
jgi:Tfp pilus assembly protein PilV